MLFDKQMFDSEKNLVSWVQKNSRIMFGEELKWHTLHNFRADLFGYDSEGKSVIVEVKLWSDDENNRRTQEYTCVGQIIHYANVFQTSGHDKAMRLFIISSSISDLVESSCKLLREHGFNIQHLSVLDMIEKEVEKALDRAKAGLASAIESSQ